MKNRNGIKRILCLACIALTAISITGCTTFDNFKHTFIDDNKKGSREKIYIGVIEPQSGDLQKEGQEELKGIQLANDIYGNVKGYDVELVTMDTQSDLNSSKAAIENVIKLKPTVIIGSAGEASSLIASSYVKKAKIPAITPSCTNPFITEDNKYYFRACISDTQMGEGLAEYAYIEKKSRKVGIIKVENNSAVAAVATGFSDKLDSLAGKTNVVVLNKTIKVDDNKLNGLVSAIKKSNADTIFLPVGAAKANIVFKKIEKAGMEDDITFLGTKDWNNDEFVKMMKKHPDIKIAFPSDSVVRSNNKKTGSVTAETQKFLIEYSNKYGADEVPSENTVQGYDAYLLAMNAINRSKSMKQSDVRDALAGIKGLRCATGIFTFDEKGNPIRAVNISTIKSGEIVSEYVTTSKSKAAEIKKIEK